MFTGRGDFPLSALTADPPMRLSCCFASAIPAALFYLLFSHVASGFVFSIPRGVTVMATKLRAADTTAAATATAASEVSVHPEILPANTPLPFIDDGITVVSFNVLLPNGNDGWWIYKVREERCRRRR